MHTTNRQGFTSRSLFMTVCLSLAGVVAAMAPSTAAAGPRYTMSEVSSLVNRTGAYASDINNAGAIAGSFDTGNGYETQAFLYQNGVTTNIGPAGSRGWHMNNAGEVTGIVGQTAAIFKNGTVQLLEQSDSFTSRSTAINDRGQVVGVKSFGSNRFGAFLYENGVMTDLSYPGAEETYATAINNAGQIALNSSLGAYIYHNGSYTHLLPPRGPESFTGVVGINDSGDAITTVSELYSMTVNAYLYINGRAIDMGTVARRTDSTARDINNRGQVVGHSHYDTYHPLAFLYENNTMFDLNTLVDSMDGYQLIYADSINDVGQILAMRCGIDATLGCQQVLLNPIVDQIPVPEPGSTAMLLAGLALVGFNQRRNHLKRTSQAA